MLNIFKRNLKSEYRERLIKSFPNELRSDLNSVLEIIPLENHKVELCDGKIHHVDNLIHESELEIKLDSEVLTIPSRVYFNEPKPKLEKTLNEKQKDILNCIYLRHHNGYLREKRLNSLSEKPDKWAIPYLLQLVGEYVYELLPIIDKKINENTLTFCAEFIDENPKYWQKTESRMISYWNEYYRYKFPKLKEYIGFEIVKRIKNDAQQRTEVKNNSFLL